MAKKKLSEPTAQGGLDAALTKELLADAGAGLSKDPEDYLWSGGDGTLRADDWLEDHFGRIYLERILLAIIDAHPTDDGKRIERLDAAVKHLIGIPQDRGSKPSYGSIMHALAAAWFEEYIRIGRDPNFSKIFRQSLGTDDKNKKDYCRRKFNENKDYLLRTVTGYTSAEMEEHHRRVQSIVRDLRALGVPCEDPKAT